MAQDDRSARNSMYDTLHAWARKTTTSFAEFITAAAERPAVRADPTDELIYRLRQWPNLATRHRTADVLRTLSVMSSQPVNRRWILSTSGLKPRELDRLLQRLEAEGVLEIIDPARFGER
jgi:hypothetical protein